MIWTNSTVERVSVADDGSEGSMGSYAPFISSKGRYISFQSDSTNLVSLDVNGRSDIFVYDRDTNTIERVSINENSLGGNSSSYQDYISSNGEYIVFISSSDNFIPGDTNGTSDVFLVTRSNPSPPSNKTGEINWICQDTKATNYNPSQFGRHK